MDDLPIFSHGTDLPSEPGTREAHVVFVKLRPEDSAALANLELRCFYAPWSEEQFRQAFEQSVFSVFGLKRDGQLVAYIAVYHTADELEILNIGVAPEHRRTGLGGKLLGLALREAAKMGIVRSVLEVRPGNAPAIALYQAHGYTQAGRRPGYYADTGEDALIYVSDFDAEQSSPSHSPRKELPCGK